MDTMSVRHDCSSTYVHDFRELLVSELEVVLIGCCQLKKILMTSELSFVARVDVGSALALLVLLFCALLHGLVVSFLCLQTLV